MRQSFGLIKRGQFHKQYLMVSKYVTIITELRGSALLSRYDTHWAKLCPIHPFMVAIFSSSCTTLRYMDGSGIDHDTLGAGMVCAVSK